MEFNINHLNCYSPLRLITARWIRTDYLAPCSALHVDGLGRIDDEKVNDHVTVLVAMVTAACFHDRGTKTTRYWCTPSYLHLLSSSLCGLHPSLYNSHYYQHPQHKHNVIQKGHSRIRTILSRWDAKVCVKWLLSLGGEWCEERFVSNTISS